MNRSTVESFLHFPVLPRVLSMPDANWGLQDATHNNSHVALPLFASCLMSTFYIDLLTPLHWMSKCQTVTAGSSAEAEIYITKECVFSSYLS